jgi:hypothetical protein
MLDQVVSELAKDEGRRFTFPSVKFLQMWFSRQDQATKELTRKLVKNGQLEIVNGGWTQVEEATATYEDEIDNLMLGRQFLKQEFDKVPTVAWNMQGPGGSATMARLYAQLGYEAYFFATRDEDFRQNTQHSEYDGHQIDFLWRPDTEHSIRAGLIAGTGCTMDGQFMDVNSKHPTGETLDPFIADRKLGIEYNAHNRTAAFIQEVFASL